jgi:hypothetical protein
VPGPSAGGPPLAVVPLLAVDPGDGSWSSSRVRYSLCLSGAPASSVLPPALVVGGFCLSDSVRGGSPVSSVSFAGFVRFVSFSSAFGRNVCPRPGGSCASGLSSSSMTASLVCFFHCQCRSGSGRWSFIVLSMSWLVHGVDCCGDSKAWSCASVVADGLLPGVVRHVSGLAWRCGGRWCPPVKCRDLGCAFRVICKISRVFIVKRVCTVLVSAI